MCLCVFPRDGQGWEEQSGQGSKENRSLMTDQMKEKKEEKRDYMLCNHDNRKENTGGLKCESLCPEECKRQGWFGIINQNSLSTPERGPHLLLQMCKWEPPCPPPPPRRTCVAFRAVTLGSWQGSDTQRGEWQA